MKIFSFEQFVHYGVHHAAGLVDGVPWSFRFYGYAVSHENDNRYHITRIIGGNLDVILFERGDTLVVENDGTLTHYRGGYA